MDRRQLIRTGAVGVAALALCFLGWRGSTNGPDPATASDDASYAGVVHDVQRVMDVYAGLAQQVQQHAQVHVVDGKMTGMESSLGLLAKRAGRLGTAEGDDLARLAAYVAGRGAQARNAAAADHTGDTSILALQAFGREVALHALALGSALEAVDAGDGTWSEVEDEVARPWPPPAEEGLDDPVSG